MIWDIVVGWGNMGIWALNCYSRDWGLVGW